VRATGELLRELVLDPDRDGTTAAGCDQTQTRAILDDYPGSISVDPAVGTAYVTSIEGVSVVPLND